MLVSAINFATPFPDEKIVLKAPKTTPTIQSIRFDSAFKRMYSSEQLNSTTDILSSQPFPTYPLNPDNHILTFSYPKRFPLEWHVGVENDQFLEAEIVDANGVTGVTVFPTHPFPLFVGPTTDYSLTLSSVLLTAQYFNESSVNLDWNGYDVSYAMLLDSDDKIFQPFSTTMFMPSAHWGARRDQSAFATVTHEVSTLSGDFPTNIIPKFFEIVVPITNSNPSMSPDGYVGDSTYFIFDPKRNGVLKGRNRSDLLSNPVSSNINYTTGEFGLVYNHGYYVSAGDATVSYQTSALPTGTIRAFNAQTNAPIALPGNLGTDFVRLSSTIPLYFYKIPLTFQGTISPNNKGIDLYWNYDATILNNGTSAVELSSLMRDSYRQSEWNMSNSGLSAVISYQDTTASGNLSCYVAGNYVAPSYQVPASSTMVFRNNDLFQQYTVQMTLSTFTDDVQNARKSFVLNSHLANFTVNLTSYADSLMAEIDSDATINEYPVKWDITPPDNVVMYSLDNGLAISRNTNVSPTTASRISAVNLGVGRTRITHYNSEYNISAVSYWEPTNDSFLNSSPKVTGIYIDSVEKPYGQATGYVTKNAMDYPMPDELNVQWLIKSTDTVSAKASASGEIFFNDNYYTGARAKNIQFEVVVPCAENSPSRIHSDIGLKIFNETFVASSENLWFFESAQKPCDQLLTFTLSSNSGDLYDTFNLCDHAVLSTGTHEWTLSANLLKLDVAPTDLRWLVNGVEVASGISLEGYSLGSITEALSCVVLSAIGASAKNGDFPVQNYSDQFCICFKENLLPFEFEVRPEKRWNGTGFESVTSFTMSTGPSAYGHCHTENFFVSATPGFDVYHYQIGERIVESSNNTATIPVFATLSSTDGISLTAFDECFRNRCVPTQYNSVSSTTPIQLISYERPSNQFRVNDTVFNLNPLSAENTFQLTASLAYPNNTPVQVLSADLNFELVDLLGTSKFDQVSVLGNDAIVLDNWTIENPEAFLYLEENTVGEFVLNITGTFTQGIVGEDYCPQTLTLPTTSISLTAIHGPEIGLYMEKRCLSANEPFTVLNGSKLINNQYGLSTIRIDFGDSRVSAIDASVATVSHAYSAEGTYSWELTGTMRNGLLNVVRWDNFVSVSNPMIDQDIDIQRNFPSQITLPYSCADIVDVSNDWVNGHTFNERMKRVEENLQYIRSQSFIYDPILPNRYVGWLGNNKTAIIKWINSDYSNQVQQEFGKITDIVQSEGNLFLVDDNRLKIYGNGFYPRLLVDKEAIGEDDRWKELKTVRFHAGVVGALDKGTNSVYFYRWNGDFQMKLLYFFGGWGNAASKYKFYNPNDFHFGANGIIVCDTDNLSIKTYDQAFSWKSTNTYQHKPMSVDSNDNGIFVAFSNGDIIRFDSDYNVLNTWKSEVSPTTKLRVNSDFVFVATNGIVSKYTVQGSLVGTFKKQFIGRKVNAIAFSEGNLYLPEDTLIHKVCDGKSYLTIRDVSNDTALFPLSAYEIADPEYVTAEVYNDSFRKVFANQALVLSSFNGKFYEILHPCGDTFDSFETRSWTNTAEIVQTYIGNNECISYATIGRELQAICDNFWKITNVLKSETAYPVFSSDCLTWADVSIGECNRAAGGDRKPLSWYEITRGMECPTTGECLDGYNGMFSELSAMFGYFQIPYSASACEYVTTNFTGVSCLSAEGLILFPPDQ